MKEITIQKKLLDHYIKHFNIISDMYQRENIYQHLVTHDLLFGVCHCAQTQFNEFIYSNEWVKSEKMVNGFWGKYPAECSPIKDAKLYKKEVLACLTIRINILSELVKT